MTETRHLRLFVKGNADIADAALSSADGGAKLDRGVSEMAAASHPGYTISTTVETSAGFAALRQELEDGTSALLVDPPDILVLSVADDVRSLAMRAANPEEAVQAVRADLVAIVDMVKASVGAHILVANASTVDPDDATHNYHGISPDPLPLQAHRLAHMLVKVSHEEGISIIDVDRLIAEIGADGNVQAAMSYSPRACGVIAGEIVRVLEDYGFFDERMLVAQVGAKGGSR
ncbi:MAG TPA: hypothetical protein VLG28_17735 [Acidimicrobiia bacterium]|jgi:hypothetical protein|nr:hypothetical protein [Acidimicrobiia bacterium]